MTNYCLLLTVQCVESKLYKCLSIPSIGTGLLPFPPYSVHHSAVGRPRRLEHGLSNFRQFLTYRIFLISGLNFFFGYLALPLGSTCLRKKGAKPPQETAHQSVLHIQDVPE